LRTGIWTSIVKVVHGFHSLKLRATLAAVLVEQIGGQHLFQVLFELLAEYGHGFFQCFLLSTGFSEHTHVHSKTGWWFQPVKNISQMGLLFPIYGRIKFMFQTTN
jgi:hypothetical protein